MRLDAQGAGHGNGLLDASPELLRGRVNRYAKQVEGTVGSKCLLTCCSLRRLMHTCIAGVGAVCASGLTHIAHDRGIAWYARRVRSKAKRVSTGVLMVGAAVVPLLFDKVALL